ncbi:phosphoribomutase [Monosporozyma unispora]
MSQEYIALIETVPQIIRSSIKDWLRIDQNQETRDEVVQLCQNRDWDELEKRFSSRIVFGTAGLRARMEAGTNRLNSLVILQATQGLAKYIAQQFPSTKVAVVGHDHRFHSKEFAEVTASIFLRAGFKVYYLNPQDTFVHTPMVPFAVDHVGASVGIMITASHNPKMDNGYKVYYKNGCQIIPPHDANIATCIDENLEPWSDNWDWTSTLQDGLNTGELVYAKEELTKEYIKKVREVLTEGNLSLGKSLKKPWFVYTPMHGVGYEIFNEIGAHLLGLTDGQDYISVPEQIVPDPSFPTVSFPNPEEKGALDKAIELAEKNNISLVVANDPDADRFSIAVKNSTTRKWSQLTGNEIGFLFATFQLESYKQLPEDFQRSHTLAFLNSTVSSQMIKAMAEKEGFHYEDTLTGFKWIGNRARDLEKKNFYVPFGYEEAIGYMFPAMEHDKDGISATVVFLIAYNSWLEKRNKYPQDILEEGLQKYGVFKEYNGYYIIKNQSMMKPVFDYIRYEYDPSNKYPQKIGDQFEVTYFRDLTVGFQSDTPDHKPTLFVDANSQMISIKATKIGSTDETVRFTMRGSGTEPKLKVYIEACSSTEDQAQNLAKLTWDTLRKELFRPDVTGLTTDF